MKRIIIFILWKLSLDLHLLHGILFSLAVLLTLKNSLIIHEEKTKEITAVSVVLVRDKKIMFI
jgi:hypothetical protein